MNIKKHKEISLNDSEIDTILKNARLPAAATAGPKKFKEGISKKLRANKSPKNTPI
jgi:hypothetical protein